MQNYLNVREKMNLAHNEFPNACETWLNSLLTLSTQKPCFERICRVAGATQILKQLLKSFSHFYSYLNTSIDSDKTKQLSAGKWQGG